MTYHTPARELTACRRSRRRTRRSREMQPTRCCTCTISCLPTTNESRNPQPRSTQRFTRFSRRGCRCSLCGGCGAGTTAGTSYRSTRWRQRNEASYSNKATIAQSLISSTGQSIGLMSQRLWVRIPYKARALVFAFCVYASIKMYLFGN